MEKIRSFIAIELNPQLRNQIGLLQAKLKKSGADVKWVREKNIHLTLKFLGYVEENKLSPIKEALKEISQKSPAFQATISELGAFPKGERPRVIWVGIDKGREEIIKLAQQLEEKLEKLGFPKEKRPFSPHITIGRLRSNQNIRELTRDLERYRRFTPLSEEVTKLVLFKSTLTPQGPIYQTLDIANLKNPKLN